MDFTNRTSQSQSGQPASVPQAGAAVSSRNERSGRGRQLRGSKWGRIGGIIMLLCILVLVVAALGILIFGNGDQSKFINNKKYQAVFLTNGQVYFGHIQEMGNSYIQLGNIYYLTQNTSTDSSGNTSSNGNYTLVKLGCQQIHDPYDKMIINRSQVSFWENLQDGGKVVSSIQQFQKQNPNGPDCSQVSSQTQASTNAGAQGTSGENSTDTNNNTTDNSNSSSNSNSSTGNSSTTGSNSNSTPTNTKQ